MCRTHAILLVSVALLLLRGSSCIHVDRPYPPPSAAAVVAVVQTRSQRVHSLRAETRMSHQTDQGRVRATVRLMARRGGALRFDAVTPFDTPLATLVTDGQRFVLVDAQKNRHYHGRATPCNIARLLQVVLAPDDVLTILGGSTPVIGHESAALAWDDRAAAEVLTLKSKTLAQTIRLDGTDRRWDLLLSEIRDAKGDLLLRITADGYRSLGGLRVPASIQVVQPRQQAQLDVSFKQLELNITLPAAAFQLPEAGGLPSQQVDCDTVVSR